MSTDSPSPAARVPRGMALLVGLLVVAVALASLQHVRPSRFYTLLARGDEQRAGYLYLSAAESYQQAAQLDSRDPEALLRLGEVYLELQQYPAAVEAFAAASQRGGNTPAVHSGMARALQGHGDFAGAVYNWQQLIAQQPDDVQARLGLASTWLAQENWGQAQLALNEVLVVQPDSATAHFSLGQLAALDDPDSARLHLHAARLDPAYEAAARQWLDALADSDDDAYRAARLGRLSLAEGSLGMARRALEQAVALNPAYGEAHAYLGHVLDRSGDDGAAYLAKAVELAPDSVVAHYLWGLHLRQNGDPAAARAEFEAALARDPSNPALMVEIGLCVLQGSQTIEDYVEGESWLVKAAETEPDNSAWAKQLAHYYLDTMISVEEKGLPSAQEAARLAPGDAEAYDLLGWAYYLTSRFPAAYAELQHALELNPRSALAHYHMSAVWVALKQPEQARQSAERAASLDPAGELGRRAREKALSE
ncbi:MAG: tetratricopeptide repeat protein [Thermoflexales bacterium]|nr:tetratricopeptide repeat protein [Thermoflexales bacterium]